MSSNGKSRRSFLVDSVVGMNAAWLTANYPGILAAQEHVRMAVKAGQTPPLTFFTADQAVERLKPSRRRSSRPTKTPGAARGPLPLLYRPGFVHFRQEQCCSPFTSKGFAGSSSKWSASSPRWSSEEQIKALTGDREGRRSSERSAPIQSSGSFHARNTAAITTRSAGS